MSFIRIDTSLDGVFILEPRVYRDDRGFFYESYHAAKLRELGVSDEFVQDNHSRSQRGVLRGLHYQDLRAPMAKLVRCSLGSILDVAVDLRTGSPTFGHHVAVELTSENARQLYVPVGFGHGFVVTSDVAEVQYKCSSFYAPQHEGAIRYDDPDLGIPWPAEALIVSERDAAAPSLAEYLVAPAFRFPAGSVDGPSPNGESR